MRRPQTNQHIKAEREMTASLPIYLYQCKAASESTRKRTEAVGLGNGCRLRRIWIHGAEYDLEPRSRQPRTVRSAVRLSCLRNRMTSGGRGS